MLTQLIFIFLVKISSYNAKPLVNAVTPAATNTTGIYMLYINTPNGRFVSVC